MFRYVKEKFLTPEELDEQRKEQFPILRENLIKNINDQLIIDPYNIELCDKDQKLFFILGLSKELKEISKLEYLGAEGYKGIWKLRFRKVL